MVIDKSTGRGCAWSIASKTVAKRLIADGIMGKAIYRKPLKDVYAFLQVVEYSGSVYVMSQRNNESLTEPLWVPSFIDAGVWAQAVSRFRNFEPLDRNVEKYLLPEMEEYLQSIPDAELVSMTRDFLIGRGVMNIPISHCRGKTYYFNKNEVYSLDKNSELFPYEDRVKFRTFEVFGEICFNMNVWRKAVSQFKVGMTLKECVGIFLNTELVHGVPRELSPVDKLVQHIFPPVYERAPENTNAATFDYIRMTVGLPRYQFSSWEALQNEVKKHQQDIYQRVVQRLEKDVQFKKYGIPMSFLKLSDVTLLRDFSMEFIFDIKDTSPQDSENK